MIVRVDLDQFQYGKKAQPVLRDVHFEIGTGQILTILGQNGTGKTTLLHCLLGYHKTYSGAIEIDGREVRELSIHQRAQAFAYVASSISVHQDLRVADYLVTGFTNSFSLLGSPKGDHYLQAHTMLDSFGQASLYDRLLSRLSAGERQMVMICRAILQGSLGLILDEPTANLDLGHQEKTLAVMARLANQGSTIITTTHNLTHALSLGGRVLLLTPEKALYGDAHEIITKERIESAYDVGVDLVTINGKTVISFSAK